MMWVDVISRIVHVSTAIVLVGGSVFNLFIVLPVVRESSADASQSLVGSLTARWKSFVHLGVVLFLVTGFYNYFRAMPLHRGDGLYHALVGVKILLALFVFFVASALVGRSAGLEKIRQQRAFWLRILVLVSAVIVGISGFVKVRGGTPPVSEMIVEQEEAG
jgi:uncharacterized membrane protein